MADLNIQEQVAPFQDGTTPIDQLFKPREVVLEGAILYPNDFSEIACGRRAIISGLNPKAGPGSAIYTNNLKSYALRNVVPEGPLFPDKQLPDPYQTFQVTFHCHDPYLYDTFAIEDTISVGGSNASVNSGDVMSDLLLAINGPCVNPKITNQFNGESIAYVGTLLSTQSLVINTAFGSKSATLYTGGVASNAMASISPSSIFFGLGIGSTGITFSVSSGTPTCTLTHTNRYIGA
jgi:hypothetical protein